jgi:hypothetical protein
MSEENAFTPAQVDDLRVIAGVIIPASEEFDVPGAEATSSAAMGWKRPGENLTTFPSVLSAAMPPRNSGNWDLRHLLLQERGSQRTLCWRGVDSNFWFRNSHHAAQDRPL